MHLIWQKLIGDRERNELIISDIAAAIRRKRVPIVLSDRKDQLATLRDAVREALGSEKSCLAMIEGSLSIRQRTAAIEEFLVAIQQGRSACLFATSSLLGEGFDLPACIASACPRIDKWAMRHRIAEHIRHRDPQVSNARFAGTLTTRLSSSQAKNRVAPRSHEHELLRARAVPADSIQTSAPHQPSRAICKQWASRTKRRLSPEGSSS